jgi:hypothetical protein
MNKTLKFDVSNSSEAKAFANLCQTFNEKGVPFGVTQDCTTGDILLEIGTGY